MGVHHPAVGDADDVGTEVPGLLLDTGRRQRLSVDLAVCRALAE